MNSDVTTTTKSNTVYLIDDDKMCNHISSKMIKRAGFSGKTMIFARATEALNSLKQLFVSNSSSSFPEIILLDINMPEMDGWAFLDEFERFNEQAKHACKVFMLSSSIDDADIERSRSYKTVQRFISKPLTSDSFRMLF